MCDTLRHLNKPSGYCKAMYEHNFQEYILYTQEFLKKRLTLSVTQPFVKIVDLYTFLSIPVPYHLVAVQFPVLGSANTPKNYTKIVTFIDYISYRSNNNR